MLKDYKQCKNCFVKRDIVAFFPFSPFSSSGNGYHNYIQEMLSSKYTLMDFELLDDAWTEYDRIKAIYLNWIESKEVDDYLRIIRKAKEKHVSIIWVFHNRLPHNYKCINTARSNMKSLAELSDVIIIHSKRSIDYLSEYVDVCNKRIEFIPHPNYIGEYGFLGKIGNQFDKSGFIFGAYGGLRSDKNNEILIKAYNTLPKEWNCKLLIVGKGSETNYKALKKLASGNKSIIIENSFISSLEMGNLIELSDVLVLPYDINSCMNSGTMIMSFSYRRSVITSSIAMADDYSDDLIYKYTYDTDADHVLNLSEAMRKAYLDGRESVRKKGEKLYELVSSNNSKQIVKDKLLEIV